MGREVYDFAKESIGYGSDFVIKGFLDPNLTALDAYTDYPNVISNDEDYEIQPDDVFIIEAGDVNLREKLYNKMIKRGAVFYTLIHKSSHVSPSATIEDGCLILSNASVGSDVHIGKNSLIQIDAILGHDSRVGEHCRIDCKSLLVGGVIVKDKVIIHTASVINHNVIIESNSMVGACSFVIRKVKEGTTVFGNPAKILKF